MEFGRLKYPSPVHYDPRVLLGNWVEERNCYVKKCDTYKTTNNIVYTPKSYVGSNSNIVWDNAFRDEGYGREMIFDHDGLNYMDNFSTTYNLSYYHLPKLFRAQPQNLPKNGFKGKVDLTLNYGPITNRGLREMKMFEWSTYKSDPRVTVNSYSRDIFKTPERTTPVVIFNNKCHYIPGELGCNPITWECVDEMKRSKKSALCSIKKKHI